MKTLADRWNDIFHQTAEEKLGWHENDYTQTLTFLNLIPEWKSAKMFIPGVGTSGLIELLLRSGPENSSPQNSSPKNSGPKNSAPQHSGSELVLNDISSQAIEIAKHRYGDKKDAIQWLCQDISTALPADLDDIDIWIDRAVLHFLVDDAAVEAYFRNVHAAVKPGGYALFAEFSKTGASKCAGLDVRRYDLDELQHHLRAFEWMAGDEYTYINPTGESRPYLYALFKRTMPIKGPH